MGKQDDCFDLNQDGNIDAGEEFLKYELYEHMTKENENRANRAAPRTGTGKKTIRQSFRELGEDTGLNCAVVMVLLMVAAILVLIPVGVVVGFVCAGARYMFGEGCFWLVLLAAEGIAVSILIYKLVKKYQTKTQKSQKKIQPDKQTDEKGGSL